MGGRNEGWLTMHLPKASWISAMLFAVGMMAIAQDNTAKKAEVVYNFDSDALGKAPDGFASYASGGGPAGKWLVKDAADAPSGKHVVEQTDADRTNTRFPILIADKDDYFDVDVSVKGKAISGKRDQGIGLVFRFRDTKSYYVVRANALEKALVQFREVARFDRSCPRD